MVPPDLDAMAELLGDRAVIAIIHPDNVASRRVAEKIGMRLNHVRYEAGVPPSHIMRMTFPRDGR
jgi:RimJ/RimL family protein N-acetyltransferase